MNKKIIILQTEAFKVSLLFAAGNFQWFYFWQHFLLNIYWLYIHYRCISVFYALCEHILEFEDRQMCHSLIAAGNQSETGGTMSVHLQWETCRWRHTHTHTQDVRFGCSHSCCNVWIPKTCNLFFCAEFIENISISPFNHV